MRVSIHDHSLVPTTNMKHLLLLLWPLLLTGCNSNATVKDSAAPIAEAIHLAIPTDTVAYAELDYDRKTSLWKHKGKLFSGYALSYYDNGNHKESISILDGKQQNQSFQWYPDGHLKETAAYHQGRLHGQKLRWAADSSHQIIAQLNYQAGKAHGEQLIWYPSGELFKKLNLNMGREEGIQQAYRKNGALYANYEARDGRVFGLKKAALCFGIEDENIQYEK